MKCEERVEGSGIVSCEFRQKYRPLFRRNPELDPVENVLGFHHHADVIVFLLLLSNGATQKSLENKHVHSYV